MIRLVFLALALGTIACGSSNNTQADAKVFKDAPGGATVMSVTCPATPAATITTSNTAFVYSPNAATITQGQVVKFVMSSTHNVVPNASSSDSGLNVDFGATTCLMFTHTGTFGFHCAPHGFMGTVTVQ